MTDNKFKSLPVLIKDSIEYASESIVSKTLIKKKTGKFLDAGNFTYPLPKNIADLVEKSKSTEYGWIIMFTKATGRCRRYCFPS